MEGEALKAAFRLLLSARTRFHRYRKTTGEVSTMVKLRGKTLTDIDPELHARLKSISEALGWPLYEVVNKVLYAGLLILGFLLGTKAFARKYSRPGRRRRLRWWWRFMRYVVF